MFQLKRLASLVLVVWVLIRGTDAGCKYTNPQWIGDESWFMTAPSLHLTFNGVKEEDQVKRLLASALENEPKYFFELQNACLYNQLQPSGNDLST